MKKAAVFLSVFLLLARVLPTACSVSAAQVFLSQNKAYKLLTPASAGYPDDERKLTDGKYGTPVPTGEISYFYRDPAYVGFPAENADENGNFRILLDLGERFSQLTSFELGYLNETSAGIFAPLCVAFAVSDDSEGEFVPIGEVSLSEPTEKGSRNADLAVLTPETPVSARFLLCTVTPRTEYTDENGKTVPTRWTFLDELVVLQGNADVWNDASFPPSRETALPQTADETSLTLPAASAFACLLSLFAISGMSHRKRPL